MKLFVHFLLFFSISGIVSQESYANETLIETRSAFEISKSLLSPELAKVIPMLKKREFDYVEKYYVDLIQAYENDPINEAELRLAIDYFSQSGQELHSALDDYLLLYEFREEDSYVAHLLRGIILFHKGWNVRGAKYRSQTKEEKLEEMKEHFELALADFDKAILLYPKDVFARFFKIGILKNYKKRKHELDKAYSDALEANPLSYLIRAAYLDTLSPRWGGSFEKMKEYVISSGELGIKNPKLATLVTRFYDHNAEYYWVNKEYEKSVELRIDAAIYSEGFFKAAQYHTLGAIFFEQGKYPESIAAYNMAIEIRPTRLRTIARKLDVEDYVRKLKKNGRYIKDISSLLEDFNI